MVLTDSIAAQRTSREPCLVIRPRWTWVSDSWCLGVSPAQQVSFGAEANDGDVADLGDEHRPQCGTDARDDLDFEVDLFAGMVRGRMAHEPGYTAVQAIPGIGPTLGAVFVAEIGDITRFASAPKLTCWAGLTPRHHESDTHVHRGRITKQGSRLVRWAAIESVKTISATTPAGVLRERVADRRGRNIGSVAAARRQLEFVFYALRDGHVRALEHPPRVA